MTTEQLNEIGRYMNGISRILSFSTSENTFVIKTGRYMIGRYKQVISYV